MCTCWCSTLKGFNPRSSISLNQRGYIWLYSTYRILNVIQSFLGRMSCYILWPKAKWEATIHHVWGRNNLLLIRLTLSMAINILIPLKLCVCVCLRSRTEPHMTTRRLLVWTWPFSSFLDYNTSPLILQPLIFNAPNVSAPAVTGDGVWRCARERVGAAGRRVPHQIPLLTEYEGARVRTCVRAQPDSASHTLSVFSISYLQVEQLVTEEVGQAIRRGGSGMCSARPRSAPN